MTQYLICEIIINIIDVFYKVRHSSNAAFRQPES